MRFFKQAFLIIILSINVLFSADSFLKDKFKKAEIGDYIVTLQNHVYSVISIQNLKEEKIILCEISIPQKLVNKKKFSWKTWVNQNAPDNISYTFYEIDLTTCKLYRCFSVSRNCFFCFSDQDNLLSKLLMLPLNKPLPESLRKKIGPISNESLDTRALWNPPMRVDGITKKNPKYIVYQTIWPKDETELSEKIIDLYFDTNNFISFPLWIQVSNGNIEVVLKIVDSGKDLICNLKMPE